MSFDIFIKLNGGLSDILYQTSAAFIVACKTEKRLTVSVDNIKNDYLPLLQNIKQHPSVNCKNGFYDSNILSDDLCAYIPKSKKNMEMFGSFKNKNYFKEYKDVLIKVYNLESDKDYTNSMYIYIDNSYVNNKETYVSLLNENRYGDLQIIIDSNNYDSIKKELLELYKEVTIVENNDYNKLCVMTNCGKGGHSTGEELGWWGSFLNDFTNKNKTVHSNMGNSNICDFDLYTKIVGGFGNQLFMIFNTIALSKRYNKKFNFYYDEDYITEYLNSKNTLRKSSSQYELFKNIDFRKEDSNVLSSFEKITEPNYTYNEIILDKNKKYIINGYFQSYKYFWEYKDDIKKNLFIDHEKIDLIKNKLSLYGKEILSIHMRLGDYTKLQDYHPIQPIEYYKKALSFYNLDNYQIILFSDDIKSASEKLKKLDINFITADELYTNDEEQFYMLCLSKIRICANSTFSLMSCYLNEMYNFVENPEYIFSNIWFGSSGCSYNIDDLIPIDNSKFKIIQLKKCAVIFFHKNIYNLYKKYWIEKSRDSILNQTNVIFDIFEINYGNENKSIFDDVTLNHVTLNHNKISKYYFYKENFETHTEAMIYLLNKTFDNNQYDMVFNTNLDDFYDTNRFYYQYLDIIYNKSVLNSTLFSTIQEDEKLIETDNIMNTLVYENEDFKWKKYKNINYSLYDSKINYDVIKKNLQKNHNVICHPSVCFTYDFWNSQDKYGNKIRYRNDKPFEDLSLWTRAIENNIKINIINKNLVWYRIHNNSIGSQQKKATKDISLYEKLKDFSTEPDYSEYNIGFLVILYDDNFEKIFKLENEILHNKKKFYLIYVKKEFEQKLLDYLIKYNIKKIKIFIYNELENLEYNYITTKHRSCIEMNSDYFYNSDELVKDYVFYTILYNIKSKFDFFKYIKWGKNLLNFIANYKLIIFTDNYTLNMLKKEININKDNITIIIKNLNELEYQCDDIFLQNTDKKYFPYHEISYDLIKIWINRHLLVKDVRKLIFSNNYCYIDWGYIRDDNGSNIKFDCSNIKNDKIYIGIINNNIKYLENIIDKIKNFDKYNIEKTLLDNLYSIGGGFILIPYHKVGYWYNIYKLFFNKFILNNIDFKDDQTIIRQIVFDDKQKNNFNLITDYNIINWFPFIKFLKKNDNDHNMIL